MTKNLNNFQTKHDQDDAGEDQHFAMFKILLSYYISFEFSLSNFRFDHFFRF